MSERPNPDDSAMTLRPLAAGDHAGWHALWRDYLVFYREDLPANVTAATWQRLLAPGGPQHCLVAEDSAAGRSPVAFITWLMHPSTWSIEPICYAEDLFVAPSHRRRGLARRLLEAAIETARADGAGRVYWTTARDNASARRLYDRIADESGFVQYRAR